MSASAETASIKSVRIFISKYEETSFSAIN